MELVTAALMSPLLLAIWRDMRKRTNGQGPIAAEIRDLKADVSDLSADVRDVKAEVREIKRGLGT